MKNPILMAIKKIGNKDIFTLFNVVLKYCPPGLVKWFLNLCLKDRAFEKVDSTSSVLKTNVFGSVIASPIGLSSGFDDEAEVVDELCHLGLGFGELGTFTLKGDDTYQVSKFFRKINTIFYRDNGFHNPSCKEIAPKLAFRYGKKNVVGVSIGEDQTAKDPSGDILKCIPTVAPYADYIVINLGNPSYIGAKILQNELKLHDLLVKAKEQIKIAAPLKKTGLYIKVPSDATVDAKRVLVERCFSAEVDGIIVAGPVQTVPEGAYLKESELGGAFCGQAIFEDINKAVREYYYLTAGKMPIIATGGVFTGKDAYKRIRSGASLVQIYSALLFNGPSVISDINIELASLLKADGFKNVKDAVGYDLKRT